MKLCRLCFLIVFLLIVALGQVSRAQEKPNVLFIAIDDLNDWIGCLDSHPLIQTPHIDRLAAKGTLFTNAHCQAPLCNSSRTSLLSGLRPSTTGVYSLQPWFRSSGEYSDHLSLTQYFRENGYRTMLSGKIWHGGYPPRPERPSEADVWGPGSSVGARPAQKVIGETPGGNHPLMDWGTFPHEDEEKGDWAVASWAVDQLNDAPEEPFFMGVGFFLPHVPCYATQKWFDLYPDDESVLPPIRDDDRADVPDFAWYLHWKLPEPRTSWLREANQLQPLSRAYLASISFVDSQVGRVLDALEESGLEENTIVVLWSDHGFHLGEKGVSGKNTLWERSTRVPLVISGPGLSGNQRCSQPVELLDLYPTLLDLCGLEPNSANEGISLSPQLKNPFMKRLRPAITTHNKDNHSIRSERWRYIRYADGSEELYDMLSDPQEWTNLAGLDSYQDVKSELAEWLPKVNAEPMPGSRSRLLVFEDGKWIWEGKPIDHDEWEK